MSAGEKGNTSSAGGLRDARLESGSSSTFDLSSSSSSSLDDPEAARRAGGSLSPRAMVRVGGGRCAPNALRSVGYTTVDVCIGGGDRMAGPSIGESCSEYPLVSSAGGLIRWAPSLVIRDRCRGGGGTRRAPVSSGGIAAVRRAGSGGGVPDGLDTFGVLTLFIEVCRSAPLVFRRGGGRGGGGCGDARGGGLITVGKDSLDVADDDADSRLSEDSVRSWSSGRSTLAAAPFFRIGSGGRARAGGSSPKGLSSCIRGAGELGILWGNE